MWSDEQLILLLVIVYINQQVQKKGVALALYSWTRSDVGCACDCISPSCWFTFCTQGPYRSDGWPPLYIGLVDFFSSYKCIGKDISKVESPGAPCLINNLEHVESSSSTKGLLIMMVDNVEAGIV